MLDLSTGYLGLTGFNLVHCTAPTALAAEPTANDMAKYLLPPKLKLTDLPKTRSDLVSQERRGS